MQAINRYIMISARSELKCGNIRYLDCMSWYDVGAQIIILIPCVYALYCITGHFLNLSRDAQDGNNSQYQKSLRRKKGVNLILIIYLGFFMGAVLLSIAFFVPFLTGNPEWIYRNKIDRIYKFTEVLYITGLNAVNVTVGFLYWKAMRGYYVLSGMDVPFFCRRFFKATFLALYCLSASSILVTALWAFSPLIKQTPMGYVVLFHTVFSIILCIGSRFSYRKIILTKLELTERAIRLQKICSILILISSLLRIFLYALELGVNDGWYSFTRNYDPNTCMDTKPYSALIILAINTLINVMPVFVYGHLFKSELKRGHRLLGTSTSG